MSAEYLPGQMDLPETQATPAQWLAHKAANTLKPSKPQLPCDVGLFSDAAAQLDLIDHLKGEP
jgi:hypothetical protein